MKSDPRQKHEDRCLERRIDRPKLLYVCTCGLSDEMVESYDAFAAQFSDKGFQDDESRP